MVIFVVLSKLTDEGAKTLKQRPERINEVNEELERMKVKVIDQYVTLGEYDFVNIVEAPDNLTLTKALIELASRGTLRTTTLATVPVEDLVKELKMK